MRDADESSREWRGRAAELADELRAIAEALAERSFSAEDLTAAGELARRIRQRLEGPRRPRWYDDFDDVASMRDESRIAYLDQSPIRGRLNPVAPPLELEALTRSDGSPGVRGRARLGKAYEGPPHGVHGGWVAALFDEVLGSVQGLSRDPGVTASLTVRYRQVTPIEENLRFEGWIHERSGRRAVAKATCHAGETLTAEAKGLFVRVDFGEVQDRMRERRSRRGAGPTGEEPRS
jgi:acyl-coenzyme A thioesterase PaaI-like protein